MLAPALALVLASAPPAGGDAATLAPPAAAQSAHVQVLDSGRQAADLCEALLPSERLLRKPDVVALARAEDAQDARRAAALAGRYQLRVPTRRLVFDAYDREEGRLSLSERTFLYGAGGSLWIWALHDADLPVIADEATASRIVAAARRGELALVVTFTLPDDDDEDVTCGHAAGSRKFTLGVEPYRWDYVLGDEVLARGGEGADRPLRGVAQGAVPRVRVSDPIDADAPELRAAVEARRPDLAGCYVRALRQEPLLDGTYVADLEAGPGPGSQVHLAVDSVQDDGMAACVTAVLARVTPRPGLRAAVPIHFELAAPPSPPAAAESGVGSGRY